MIRFLKSLFFEQRLAFLLAAAVMLFALGFAYEFFFVIGKGFFILLCSVLVTDMVLLYHKKQGITGLRNSPTVLSNGDENKITLSIQSFYRVAVTVKVFEELPFQFQERNMQFNTELSPATPSEEIDYSLRPVERGEYKFGKLNCFVSSFLGLVSRRYVVGEEVMIPVYPSFVQLKKYEFMAISNRLSDIGSKQIRKIGQSTEFDQIRDYGKDDDYRMINWKATARKGSLKVNQYQDEKSQHIYCVIDKGRAMKMPFDGMSLVDYAINSSLVLLNIALKKDDKAGLITFSNKMGTVLKADNRRGQVQHILQSLYNQTTRFQESDYARLYRNLKYTVRTRSLILLYTNFESMSALKRQIIYLQAIAKEHLLVVIFFENRELIELVNGKPQTIGEIYNQAIAEKFLLEKKQIRKELSRYGIHSILTTPENLSSETINKYLQIKRQGVI